MKNEEIAIFPIPECVSFPKTTVALHVFEPRYRSMIKDCVKNQIKIGVTHIDEVLSYSDPDQTKEEILSKNQSNFKPKEIFSAGPCVIKEVTADGRFLVDVHMKQRYRLIKNLQDLPYRLCLCEPYEDESFIEKTDQTSDLSEKRKLIDEFLLSHAQEQNDKGFIDFLNSKVWLNIDDYDYSFKIFERIKFDGETAQMALEKRSAHERLRFICDTLKLSHQ